MEKIVGVGTLGLAFVALLCVQTWGPDNAWASFGLQAAIAAASIPAAMGAEKLWRRFNHL